MTIFLYNYQILVKSNIFNKKLKPLIFIKIEKIRGTGAKKKNNFTIFF